MDTLSKRTKLSILLVILAAFTVVCASSGGGGQATTSDYEGPLTATIYETSGTVQVLKASEGIYNDAVVGQELENNDQVFTHDDGRARIDLSTGTIIRLSPLSQFTFETMENTEEGVLTRLRLEVGRLWVILNGGEVEVDTPSGLASVRGSYLHVWVRPEEDTTLVTCLEGECTLGNEYGTVSLVAGQTAAITGVDMPPNTGKMSDGDVDEWLQENPEATLVIVELTATVAALEGINPNATTPPTATPLVINTKTPTPAVPTDTAVACGPPSDWVLHSVLSGETLEILAAAYQVAVSDLQYANCRGDSTAVVAGESLFVPNVATITPTPTATLRPTATKTPVPTTIPATVVPTNSPSVFSSPVGPAGTDLSSTDDPALCSQVYSVNVTDVEGISEVKMIYSVDGSIPDWNSAVGAGNYKLLSSIGGGTYEGTYAIPSWNALAGVVKYRFAAKDSSGNIAYEPSTGAYSFTDSGLDCGYPTSFDLWSGPDGKSIPVSTSCTNLYEINVNNPFGVDTVEVVYKIKDNLGNVLTTGTLQLTYGGTDPLQNGKWNGTFSIPTSAYTAKVPLTIFYQFKAVDMRGNPTIFITSFSFEDTDAACP